VSYRTPGPATGRTGRGPRRRFRLTLAGALLTVGVLAAGAGLVTLAMDGRAAPVPGHAGPVPSGTGARSRPTTSTSVAPVVPQDNWTTLINPASGLSYQIPPAGWTTAPQAGQLGAVTLAQGAERTAYTCGTPPERLLRGVLGSGRAPRTDPATLAVTVARAAAVQYYSTGGTPPKVTVDPAEGVRRGTRSGATLDGVLVRAIATQHADPCLASQGEILVFVLRFPDHDGVLLVNADMSGGPDSPAPATDRELRAIVGTAGPTT
jgi:hypothetical protein